MFEPVHGSAPDIYGQNIANPIGRIWSGAMMLDHFGHKDAAEAVVRAIETVLTDFQLPTFSGGVRTDCVVGIERDSLSGTKSLASEVPHGRDNRPLVGARARRMRVRGPAFGPALAQTHRAYGGRDRG